MHGQGLKNLRAGSVVPYAGHAPSLANDVTVVLKFGQDSLAELNRRVLSKIRNMAQWAGIETMPYTVAPNMPNSFHVTVQHGTYTGSPEDKRYNLGRIRGAADVLQAYCTGVNIRLDRLVVSGPNVMVGSTVMPEIVFTLRQRVCAVFNGSAITYRQLEIWHGVCVRITELPVVDTAAACADFAEGVEELRQEIEQDPVILTVASLHADWVLTYLSGQVTL